MKGIQHLIARTPPKSDPPGLRDEHLMRQMTARGFRNIFWVVVVVFVFAVIQMWFLQRSCNEGMKATNTLQTQGLPNLNCLADLREQLVLFRLYAYEYTFAKESQRAQLAQRVDQTKQQIHAELEQIKLLHHSFQGQERTMALDGAVAGLSQTFDHMRQLTDQDFGGAMIVLDHDVPPMILAVDQAAGELNALGYRFSGQQAQANFESFRGIKNRAYGFGMANILVALGLMVFVVMAANKTHRQLAGALAQIHAQGWQLRLQASALNAASNGMVITNREGLIQWVNPAFTRLTGYGVEEAVGKNPRILKSGEHAQPFYEHMWKTIQAGGTWSGELVNRRKDGSLYHEETDITPVRDEAGTIQNYIAVKHDISSRKRIQQALEHEKKLLCSLMDNLPDFIYFKDADCRFTRINLALARHLGLPGPEAAIGKSDADYFPRSEARQKQVDEERMMIAGQPLIGLVEESGAGVDRRWVSSTKVPLRDDTGKVTGMVGVSRDITDYKEAEIERQLMEVQLRQAQKLESIGQLAAGIAHEINTPTQYIGDNTRFLQDAFGNLVDMVRDYDRMLAAAKVQSVLPEEVARIEAALVSRDFEFLYAQVPTAIQETLEGVDRVSKIVRAMKEFSHPGGKEKIPSNLNQAIESTTTVARNEWKYVAELKLDLDASLPLVPCFLGEFNQVILNLVVNAAHAIGDVVRDHPGSKGRITVSTRLQGDQVEVRVTDTGTGIEEKHRARIFEPFFTTKDVGRGTGQGLTVVYSNIVKKHGGTVTFETEVGCGTTFILRLPLNAPTGPGAPAGNSG